MGWVVAASLVAWCGLIMLFISRHINGGGTINIVAAALVFTAGLGYLFQLIITESNSGPCVQSEIQMHYNAATKTVMPAEVCINRGKWVQP